MRISVPLKADEEGMLGRQCPDESCRKYFKIKASDFQKISQDSLFCPYCGKASDSQEFVTEGQAEYAVSVATRKVLGPLFKRLRSLETRSQRGAFLSLDIKVRTREPVVKDYFEKQSRRLVKCERCDRQYSVYGVCFYCPFCGARDPHSVFRENAASIDRFLQLEQVLGQDSFLVKTGTLRQLAEDGLFETLAEKALDMAVTAFETYCKNKYAAKMIQMVQGSRYQDWLAKAANKFQNLEKAKDLLATDLSLVLEAHLPPNEKVIVVTGLQKRHLLVHNSGIVDEKYIEAVGGDKNLIGTRISVNRREVEQFVDALARLVDRLEAAF